MKIILSLVTLMLVIAHASAQVNSSKPDTTKRLRVVEASCGMCQFGLKGGDCALAVRIDGQSYYVDGANIDEFGDAHGKDGFCNAVRKAQVQGEIVDNRFKATYFKLLPAVMGAEKKKPGH